MNNEKSFCIGNNENDGLRNSFNPIESIDRSVLAEMKKYKNCNPEDVSILKGLKLKISNYLLEAEEDVAIYKQVAVNASRREEVYTFLQEENNIFEIDIHGSSYLYDANRSFIDQQ